MKMKVRLAQNGLMGKTSNVFTDFVPVQVILYNSAQAVL